MYQDFFSLREKPFNLTPDPDFLYLSRSHKEALAHLTYGVESKSGFVLVTGDVGSGKTTLLRTLMRNLGERVLLSQVTNTRVSYKELLEMVLRDFGLHPGDLGKTALLSLLNEFLIEKFREGRNCVLVIDEAQNLGVPTLEGVRMLSNLETEKAKLLHTVLVGQPGLRTLIDSPELEQLRQRITVRYHLGPLSAGEVGEYVRHRLEKVCLDQEKSPVFGDDVIPRIHEATGGLPRLVNVLCDGSLLHAYVAESRVITREIIESVAEQLFQDQRGAPGAGSPGGDAGGGALSAKIAELEARMDVVALESASRASHASEVREPATAREKALLARELAVSKREKALDDRLTALKAEWKRRMERLEASHNQFVTGDVPSSFPALRVHLFDSDPRFLNALKELVETAGFDFEASAQYDAFVEAVRESSRSGLFAVAVVGAGQDDGVNVARMEELTGSLGHVPRVYLSDLDLSTIRRRIFAAGANYFLEKPTGKGGGFAPSREALDLLKADLLRVLNGVEKQYKAFFELFVRRS